MASEGRGLFQDTAVDGVRVRYWTPFRVSWALPYINMVHLITNGMLSSRLDIRFRVFPYTYQIYTRKVVCPSMHVYSQPVVYPADSKWAEYKWKMIVQGEHKVFPWLQTFITRKLREIQTFFLPLLKLVSKILCHLFILYIYIYIQGVPGGMCQTSGECSLG